MRSRTRSRSNALRLVLFSHYYPPEIGAAQRRLDAMVKRWVSSGIDVTVITALPHYPEGRRILGSGRLGRDTGQHGESVIRVPFVPGTPKGIRKFVDHSVVSVASLPWGLFGRRPDVIMTSVPAVPSMGAAWVAARRWRVPLIVEMRDAWPDLLSESGFSSGTVARVFAGATTGIQRRATRVVTVAEGFRKQLVKRGVAPHRVVHIPNGIDLSLVPLLPSPEPDDRLRVLYLGTHGVSQGLETVVDALARLGPSEVEGRFIGGGTERGALRDLARGRGAPIHFDEAVRGDDLWEAYAWAHTCVVPLRNWSAFRHTVPSKLYEIFACGRHVTGCLQGEAAEMVHQANGGVVVPPEDPEALANALRQLRSSPDALDVGSGPRDWVASNASYDTLAKKYLDLFHDVRP